MEHELRHEFVEELSAPLDWEQRYWFKRILRQKLLANEIGLSSPNKSPESIREVAKCMANSINENCPQSTPVSAPIVAKIMKDPFSLLSLDFSNPFTKYSYFAQALPDAWFTFMNFGFHSLDYEKQPLRLLGHEKNWKYSAQFYHRIATQVQLQGKDVLEVGSGRGGGAAFLTRYLEPRFYLAVDGTQSNTLFCNANYSIPQLRFLNGRAEALPVTDRSFDAVISVESINYYEPIVAFLDEVQRVLRPGGALLIACYGPVDKITSIREAIIASSFELLAQQDVSVNVKHAMDLFKQKELELILQRNRLSRSQNFCRNYFGSVYDSDVSNYLCFVFRKRVN